jgi:hypothetical protein
MKKMKNGGEESREEEKDNQPKRANKRRTYLVLLVELFEFSPSLLASSVKSPSNSLLKRLHLLHPSLVGNSHPVVSCTLHPPRSLTHLCKSEVHWECTWVEASCLVLSAFFEWVSKPRECHPLVVLWETKKDGKSEKKGKQKKRREQEWKSLHTKEYRIEVRKERIVCDLRRKKLGEGYLSLSSSLMALSFFACSTLFFCNSTRSL